MSYQSKHQGQTIDNNIDIINEFLNKTYPIGSIYMNINNVNPGTLFGGTWEQIQDRFLLAAGSSYAGGSTGGAASHTHTSAAHTHTTAGHTLTINEMPSHTHPIYYDPNFCAVSTGNNNSWKQGLVNVGYPYGNYPTNQNQPYSGGGASHSHGDTGSTTPSNTGSSSNLPPYLTVYIWKRIA